MRVTFSPGDPKFLRELFSPSISFIDISITRELVYIILTDSTTIYVHKSFPVISMEDFREGVIFRVERKSFFSFLRKGHIAIYVPDNKEVELSIDSGNYKASMVRPFQNTDRSSFVRFADAIKNRSSYRTARFSSLEDYSTLLRQFGGLVHVEDGVLHTRNDSVDLYIRVDCANFTLQIPMLFYLLRTTESHYTYQDNIIGLGEDCVVVLKQSYYGTFNGIEYIEDPKGIKRTHLAKVDFTSACILAQSCEMDNTAVLDFDLGSVTFKEDKDMYKTTLKVHSLDSRELAKERHTSDSEDLSFLDELDSGSVATVKKVFPRLEVSVRLLRSILPTVNRSFVNVSIRKSFVCLDIGEKIYFVIAKCEV